MSHVKIYWSDEVDYSPATPAIKFPFDALALPLMSLPDAKDNNRAAIRRCPAFLAYFKNAYVYRSPVDIEIFKTDTGYSWRTSLSEQSEADALVQARDQHGLLSIKDYARFWCEESVVLEQLQPTFIDNDFTKKCEVVPGAFDISKWFRPLQPAFKLRSGVDSVSIKRGDVLYIARFLTDKKVEMVRFDTSPKINYLQDMLSRVSSSTPSFYTSLKNYYEIFARRRYAEQITREIKNNVTHNLGG